MLTSTGQGGVPRPIRVPLAVVTSVALLAGLYGRFKGIGTWPLGVDEFYISRSIDSVLRFGVPRFPCGGYYTRGLLYQYLVAGVRLLGGSPEFSGRAVAGLSGLAVLPAGYLLGKRLYGPLAGWLTVIILSVSVWEIEMARFARMYAPFQAVFAWYAVFYLRYTIDRHTTALAWMIGLSILGVLTWEGGALLGIANILAVLSLLRQDRPPAADWRRLTGLLVLLVLLRLGTADLRGFADLPDAAAGAPPGAASPLQFAVAWVLPLEQHAGWAGVWLLALIPAFASWRWIASYRPRWLAVAGLCATLTAAALHIFAAAAGLLILMLLLRWVLWRDLIDRPARYFVIALAAFLVFWAAFDLGSGGGPMGIRAAGAAAIRPVIQQLFGFPDIYDQIIRPWGRTVPMLSVWLLLALAYLCYRSAGADPAGTARTDACNSIAVLLTLILVMALAVGAIPTPRVETRYTFFLYPLLIALAVTATLTIIGEWRLLRRASVALGATIPLVCFAATEDFQPRHIVRVDSESINFRIGMSADRAVHYYPRNDMRVIGEWLAAHVKPGDVVITGIPNLDEYYDRFDYFYLDAGDNRYEAYVCHDGRTERWTNHAVLYTEDSLTPIVASGRRVFVSVYSDTEARLRADARSRGWSVTRAWGTIRGNTDVLLIVADAGAAAD
jgi:hypothetical protein